MLTINTWSWRIQNKPVLFIAKFLLSSGPSNIGDMDKASMRIRRNSLRGPPKSIASSFLPKSSENFTFIEKCGLYVTLLNPRMAPSKTAERFILNLQCIPVSIFLDNSSRMSFTGKVLDEVSDLKVGKENKTKQGRSLIENTLQSFGKPQQGYLMYFTLIPNI